MDLGTIKEKLDNGDYSTPEDVVRDIRLVWSNALKYNLVSDNIYSTF